MTEIMELRGESLHGDLRTDVDRFLRDAFPDDGPNEGDYYRAVSEPDVALLLLKQTKIFAHLGLYTRSVVLGDEPADIGMLGGIAVEPEMRRKGYARQLIRRAHDVLRERGVAFSILFAFEPAVYVSSGYRLMQNETRFLEPDGTSRTLVYRGSMVAELGARRWPNRVLDMRGKTV